MTIDFCRSPGRARRRLSGGPGAFVRFAPRFAAAGSELFCVGAHAARSGMGPVPPPQGWNPEARRFSV
eukprot:6338981-Lingulodinium_polyedra.AAC.1